MAPNVATCEFNLEFLFMHRRLRNCGTGARQCGTDSPWVGYGSVQTDRIAAATGSFQGGAGSLPEMRR